MSIRVTTPIRVTFLTSLYLSHCLRFGFTSPVLAGLVLCFPFTLWPADLLNVTGLAIFVTPIHLTLRHDVSFVAAAVAGQPTHRRCSTCLVHRRIRGRLHQCVTLGLTRSSRILWAAVSAICVTSTAFLLVSLGSASNHFWMAPSLMPQTNCMSWPQVYHQFAECREGSQFSSIRGNRFAWLLDTAVEIKLFHYLWRLLLEVVEHHPAIYAVVFAFLRN